MSIQLSLFSSHSALSHLSFISQLALPLLSFFSLSALSQLFLSSLTALSQLSLSALFPLSSRSLPPLFQLCSTILSALFLTHSTITQSEPALHFVQVKKFTHGIRSDGGDYSGAVLQMRFRTSVYYCTCTGQGSSREVGEGQTFRSTI